MRPPQTLTDAFSYIIHPQFTKQDSLQKVNNSLTQDARDKQCVIEQEQTQISYTLHSMQAAGVTEQ